MDPGTRAVQLTKLLVKEQPIIFVEVLKKANLGDNLKRFYERCGDVASLSYLTYSYYLHCYLYP